MMNLYEVNPFIRYARMHSYYQPTQKDSICYDCRLFYVAMGEGTFFANGERYMVKENLLIFLPPETRYRFAFTDNNAVRIYVLNFDLTDAYSALSHSLGTATEDDFVSNRIPRYTLPEAFSGVLVRPDSIPIRNHVEKCTDAFLEKEMYYEQIASASLKTALFEVLQGEGTGDAGYALARSVGEYIRENYAQPELSNTAISERFNYHPYHLSRIMKQFTGQTLHGYLMEYRFHMAKNYLMTTNLNVTMVAEKSGFTSYAYFIKQLRLKTGLTPLRYRQLHRKKGL